MSRFCLTKEEKKTLIKIEREVTECHNGCVCAFRHPEFQPCPECEEKLKNFENIVDNAWQRTK